MRSDAIVAAIAIIAASVLMGLGFSEGGMSVLTIGTGVWSYGRGRRSATTTKTRRGK